MTRLPKSKNTEILNIRISSKLKEKLNELAKKKRKKQLEKFVNIKKRET